MKKIEIRALLLAFAMTAILAGGLIYYIQFKAPYTGSVQKVLVASRDIPAKTVITKLMVKEETVPTRFAVSGRVKSIDKVIGTVTKDTIYAGEQILVQRLILGREIYGMAAVIPKGYRAVTLNIDAVSSVGWNIKVGDFVDVLMYFNNSGESEDKGIVKTIFQHIKVLDIVSDNNSSQSQGIITLCMNPEDSQKLFLADMVGKIRLTLRYVVDDEQLSLPATGVKSIE